MVSSIPATGYGRYIGRVGALALALGVGVAVAMGQGVARAEESGAGEGSASANTPSDSAAPGEAGAGVDAPEAAVDAGPPSGQEPDDESTETDTGMMLSSSGGLDTSTNDEGQSTDKGNDVVGEGDDTDSDDIDPVSPPPLEPTSPSAAALSGGVVTPVTQRKSLSTLDASPVPAATADTSAASEVESWTDDSVSSMSVHTTAPAQDSTIALMQVSAPQQQSLAALPATVVGVVTTFVTALLSPFVGTGPTAPAEPPLLWALLGWVRREIQRTFFNQTPTAVVDEVATPEDTPLVIDVLDNDTDDAGDELRITAVTQPTNGTVVINPDGTIAYTPNANFNGTDTFSYTISDADSPWHLHGLLSLFTGAKHTATASVTVSVTPVNDGGPTGPTAVAVTTDEDTPATGNLLAGVTDPDGDDLTVTITPAGAEEHGLLELNDETGVFTYTPAVDLYPGQSVVDTYNYTVSDGNGGVLNGALTITVTGAYDAPEVLQAKDLPGEAIGDPVVTADGTGYVTTQTGEPGDRVTHVTIFKPGDLDNPVTIDLPGAAVGPVVIGTDGTVYQTTNTDIVVGTTVYVIDPDDPTNFTPVGMPGRASGGVVVGKDGIVYQITDVGNTFNTTTYVTVIDPDNPDDFTTVDVPGSPFGGMVIGGDGKAYLTTTHRTFSNVFSTRILILDPEEPANPTIVVIPARAASGWATGGESGVVVDAHGRAYQSVDGGRVYVVDPDDPGNVDFISVPGSVAGVEGANGNIYIVSWSSGAGSANTHLTFVDADDLGNPTTVDLLGVGVPTIRPAIDADGVVYLPTDSAVFLYHRIDPADLADTITVEVAGYPSSRALITGDGTAYLLTALGLLVVDPADPANPVTVDAAGEGVLGADGRLHVTAELGDGESGYSTRVYTIDPADPANPVFVDLPGGDFGLVLISADGTRYQRTRIGDVFYVYAIDPSGTTFTGPVDHPAYLGHAGGIGTGNGFTYFSTSDHDATGEITTKVSVLGVSP